MDDGIRKWAAPANASVLPGGIQSDLGTLSEHGPLELGERPDHLHHHSPAGVVVSMASVRLRKPALASVSRSMIVRTSRSERESRSSFPHHEHVDRLANRLFCPCPAPRYPLALPDPRLDPNYFAP